jgi:hypothetical protein
MLSLLKTQILIKNASLEYEGFKIGSVEVSLRQKVGKC